MGGACERRLLEVLCLLYFTLGMYICNTSYLTERGYQQIAQSTVRVCVVLRGRSVLGRESSCPMRGVAF